jgi:hypothetical protein
MKKAFNKNILLVGAVLMLAIVGALVYYNNSLEEKNSSEKENDQGKEEIQIKERFDNKIVYEQDQDLEEMRKHCQDLVGKFNECGSPCAPRAEICAEVCAYICDLNEEKPDGKKGSDRPIVLENPQPDQKVSSPLTVTGQAPGTWFFEAEFSVVLTDWDGKIIAEAQAQAQESWMTEELVDFEAQIEFEKPFTEGDPDYMKRGSLILQKANPSGLPENDAAKETTVFFE